MSLRYRHISPLLCNLKRGMIAGLILLAGPMVSAQEPADVVPSVEILKVEEVRAGMVGMGKTVLEGTEIVRFEVKILGVMRGVGPGRDVILAKLSGANLNYTGVIAGMSGSPVYIDGKLVGAVAYTWSFNKEPIAGITPFDQMKSLAEKPPAAIHSIAATPDGAMPLAAMDLSSDPFRVLRESAASANLAIAAKSGQMMPIAVPLAASGFTPRSLADLRAHFSPLGFVPVAAGSGAPEDEAVAQSAPLLPGAPLAASLVTGDFDLSGMGTVTHVEGNQVWGWGHPFMESGRSHYMLRAGVIHCVNPKLDVSTKMGSPAAVLGVLHADVSTCVAGRLGEKPDMLPVNITVQDGPDGAQRKYKVQIVRHPELTAPLLSTVLSNALDAGGALDQEITLDLNASIQAEGLEAITIKNTYSGGSVSGSSGAKGLLNQVAVVADGLSRNPFKPARLEAIDCHAIVTDKRTSAGIVAARLNSDQFEPGDELIATVTVRPYKCDPVELEIRLPLPVSLPAGSYTATLCDAPNHLRGVFSEEPHLLVARSVPEIARVYRLQLQERRETLYLRIVTRDSGLALDQAALPQLPGSVRAALESRRSSPAMPIRRALVARKPTDWVIEGATSLKFNVVEDKRVSG